MMKRSKADEKKDVPKVGLFFVLDGKPRVEGAPWTEVPSEAGFRTHATGHPEYWEQLQAIGVSSRDMPYMDVPRDRVNYEDATGRFTLFADKCILENKRLVAKIMSELSLPKNTRALPDCHYRCPKCAPRRSEPQEDQDWAF